MWTVRLLAVAVQICQCHLLWTSVSLCLAEPPFIQEGPKIGLRAAEGQTVNLTCKVFGSPKPHVVWKQGDEQLTGGRFRVMDDGNLEISVSSMATGQLQFLVPRCPLGWPV